VATIAGTILAGAAIGAVASMTIDTAIQIEHIEVFHDQKGFDWTEFEHSVEIGVLTGGAGAGVGMATRALTPMLTEASPLLARGASSFESMPEWAQAGLRGTLLGGAGGRCGRADDRAGESPGRGPGRQQRRPWRHDRDHVARAGLRHPADGRPTTAATGFSSATSIFSASAAGRSSGGLCAWPHWA
jgi:hypothetical protein